MVKILRVPKIEHFSDDRQISVVEYQKPITIPRLPVITNEKQRDKLIKSIETYVRSSMEYKDLIKYLRDNINMDHCHFFHNFKAGKKKGQIEIHHEPFDLYTIVSIVCKKHELEYGYIDELMVAEEVMRIHYEGLVGLIPLSITPHELVHVGKLAIPLNCVYGKFVQFVAKYFDYIKEIGDGILLSVLQDKVELTKKLSAKDLSILNVRYIYTKIDGFMLPKLIDESTGEMEDDE